MSVAIIYDFRAVEGKAGELLAFVIARARLRCDC